MLKTTPSLMPSVKGDHQRAFKKPQNDGDDLCVLVISDDESEGSEGES
jgi:hypothetical protein